MPYLPEFFGGTDVQRSTNLHDNRCINLYPTTNDAGTVVGLVATPGLTFEVAFPGGAIGSGIYTATNGRCFAVASTVLYELTVVAGAIVLTNRGTVTAGTVTRMSDNGLDLILVNGTDGWLFTFATNALRKIRVASGVCTISNATPAVITKTAHTFVAGDKVRFSTTGALPTGLLTSTTYYVLAAGLTADTFEVSLTDGGAAINTTSAGSGTHTVTSLSFGFPNGCKTISYINGRFVACNPNTQAFYCSEKVNLVTGESNADWWDALNEMVADSNPDVVVGAMASHNELIVFGEISGEAFYDNGAAIVPFTRNVSGVFEVGCIAPYSIAKIDNSVMWLGKSTTGQGIVYRLNGYTPMRISTYSIEYAMQSMSTITDAISFTYQQDGHHFYVLTFPTGGRTFVFDVNTQLWHERAGLSLGALTRWEAQEYAMFNNKHLVCDFAEGRIYSLNLASYDDGGVVRKWIRSWRAPASDMKRVIHHKLMLDCEVGVGLTGGPTPTVMLKYSDDGGHTWSPEHWRDMGIGSLGEYAKRVFWYRLGQTKAQPRLYELSGTAAVRTVLLGVYLE